MVGVMDDYKLSSAQGFRPGVALGRALLSTPLPQTHPPLLHPPAPDFQACLSTPGKQVQEDGGGARVWVPSIALGWEGRI